MEDKWTEELHFLEEYKKMVGAQLNWGDSEHWRHSDFVHLSEKIFEKTNVLLSNTTLKRLWGKLKYESLPTSNTLNVLAQYLGYENWLAFKMDVAKNQAISVKDVSIVLQTPSVTVFKKWWSPRLLIGIGGIIGLLILFISFIFNDAKKVFTPEQLAKVQFSSQPITEGIPNTVIFNYDLGDIQSDDIQIQQSWDSTKRFRITEITNEAASMYYRPGYWRAKLIIDGQIVKEHDVFIKSQGWLVTQDFEPKPRYFLKEELVQNGYLGIDSTILEQSLGKNAEPEWLTYHYIEDLKSLQSDHFSFQVAVKNTYRRGDGVCRESKIYILCENGFIGIPLAIPGCVGDLRLSIFDYVEEGNKRDLSDFGCDFDDWQRIRLEVRNQQARLFLNEKLVRKIRFMQDAGRVVGMRARFRGAGIVDEVAFFDKNGKVVYQNTFEE